MAALTIYHYAGEPQRVNKTLTDATPITPAPIYRDAIDFHAPTIDVEMDIDTGFNYCSIEQNGRTRYYYMRVINVRRGLSRLVCDIDVLMSYDVGSVPIIPARVSAAGKNNPYIIDPRQPVETTTEHYNILFNGANFDYHNMTLVAGIVGTGGEPTNI